jgi:hypothetical protein
MDYRTNILSQQIEVKEVLLPEITGLYFGVLGKDNVVFDYTTYLTENNRTEPDYKTFMRVNKHFIEALASTANRPTSDLFYQNVDGHILVASELVFLCLAFVDTELLRYFNDLVSDALSEGIAYSNGFIYSMAANRLPNDVLKDIIRENENDTTNTTRD